MASNRVFNNEEQKMLKYEKRVDGTILEQLLSFIEPKFHSAVEIRFNCIEKGIELMYKRLEDLEKEEEALSEKKKKKKKKKKTCFCYKTQKNFTENKVEEAEKRVFLTGGAASFLIGRENVIDDVLFLLCYNGKIYNMTECANYDKRVCIWGGANDFYEDFFSPQHWDATVTMHIRSTVEPKNSSLDSLKIFEDYIFFSEFIELTDRNNIKLYTRECECDYLDVKKRIGYPYPIMPKFLKEVANPDNFCGCARESVEDRASWTNAPHKEGLDRGLNFLKSICNECDYRTDLQKCAVEIWRQYTYRVGSKVFCERKKDFEENVKKTRGV